MLSKKKKPAPDKRDAKSSKTGSGDGAATGNGGGRLLPNHNLPNIDGEDDGMDMSPLKRLQRLKENGNLSQNEKRTERNLDSFSADVENSSDHSDASLSEVEEARIDMSGGSPKSCVKVSKDTKSKNVRFLDDVSDVITVVSDSNGNNSNLCENATRDSNGNLNTQITRDISSGVKTSETNKVSDNMSPETNDVDSETGEIKANSPQSVNSSVSCRCDKRVKPAIPAKPPNLARLRTKSLILERPTSKAPSSPKTPEKSPKPVTLISAQNDGDDAGKTKDNSNTLTVEYTPIPKPVIEVKLIQRQSRSQTPSPVTARHGSIGNKNNTVLIRSQSRSQNRSSHEEKWLSRSVDDLDKPVDIYACPTSFLGDGDVKLRHSFIDKGFTDKEREAIYNSVGDVQTLLRNSFVTEDEKIYSLPQPACYGDNTLKAVKKITEKYDTLQRRKLRALSFREGAKYSGAGVTLSQPSSPVTPPSLPGGHPPDLPTSPPPPLSATSEAGSSVFGDLPDGSVGYARGVGSARSPVPPPPPPRLTPSPSSTALYAPSSSSAPSSPSDPAAPLLTSTPLPSPTPAPAREGVTARDTSRLDLFYHGRDTEVIVGQSLADLRFGTAVASGSAEVSDWSATAVSTGVPLLVLNTGKGKRRRELTVTVAERATGFPLWSDKINYLSNYRATEAPPGGVTTTHVLQLSNNLKKVAGLTFHCENAAEDFLQKFQEITKDPNDDLWRVSTGSSSRATGRDRKKWRPFSFRRKLKKGKPGKSDISLPCNFSHITSVDPRDHVVYDELLARPLSPLSRSLPNSPTSSRPSSIFDG